MNKLFKIFAPLLMVATLAGCYGEKVQVPPAFEGKILSKNGYLPEAIPPSTPKFVLTDEAGSVVRDSDTEVKEAGRDNPDYDKRLKENQELYNANK